MAVFIGHRGQKLFGDESRAKASYTRVDPTTYKPVTKRYLCSHSPLLHTRGRLGVAPSEQVSNHDDARLSIMEEPVTLHLEPLDANRLLRFNRSTSRIFPLAIREPTPRHPPSPHGLGRHRTLSFHHISQPISPPEAVDYLMHPSTRTSVKEFFVISARVGTPRDHERSRYHGIERKFPKEFRRTDAETHESLTALHPHRPS